MEITDIIVTGITDVITVYSPKGRTVSMTNRKSYGISFCSEGQITYTHNGKKFVSDNRHVIILPEGQSYTLKGDITGSFPVINFNCAKPLCDTFLLFPVENTDIFIKDFEMMKKLYFFPENNAKVMSIFYNMIHNLTSEKSVCKAIDPAIKFIKVNYKDPYLSNKTISKACNISEVYLRKLFYKHLKTTPKQYITELRLQKAKMLLSEGILKIGSVSEECGFPSSYNFCRFFKDKTGFTPTEYMRQNKAFMI